MDSVEMTSHYILSIFPPIFAIFPTISSYPRSIYSTLVISVSPRAIIPARIIVTQARRSQLDTVVPFRCVRPNIMASCGFMIAICPFIFSTSMSQLRRPSKRTSWIREMPSAWERRSANGDWRSVGNPGNILVWSVTDLRRLVDCRSGWCKQENNSAGQITRGFFCCFAT